MENEGEIENKSEDEEKIDIQEKIDNSGEKKAKTKTRKKK